MEHDISVDASGISPRQSEDQTHSHTQTFQDMNYFAIKDQQEQTNNLQTDARSISCSPEQHSNYQFQSENDSETIYVRQVRHKEEVKELGDVDIAHAKDDTEIKTPEPEISMPETQKTQKVRVSNNAHQNSLVHTSNQWTELCLPPNPPQDWRLNELLDYIASHVDETELKRIKLMFTGPHGISKRVLEKCDSCLALLTVLKQRGYIARDNILYLNKILYVLQRHDLLQKTVEYCSNEGNVINYYSVDRPPDVGEKQVMVHVKADVQNYKKEELDQLRNVVANIICIPADEILISAVEPGSSFIVTFTVVKMYVDILQSLLERKVNLRRLTAIDVDIIIIDGNQYDVSGHDDVKDVNEQCKELMNVYKQLETTRKELEKKEFINMNCLQELRKVTDQLKKAKLTKKYVESLESRNSELVTLCSMLQSMYFTYGVTESSIENFQLLMTEATNKKQDKDLIQRIIRTNTEIVATCHRNRNELDHQEKSTNMGKFNEFELRRDLASGVKNAEEVLNDYFDLCLQDKFLLDVCEEVDRTDIYNMFKHNEILLLANDKHLYHMKNKSFTNLESHLDQEFSKHEEETVVGEAGATNVSAKGDSLNVTHQQRLNEMWKRTGEKETLYEECEEISKQIESMSSSILHVWPAYDTKANDDIVFVVLTKSIEEKAEVEHELTKKWNYNICVMNVDSTNKESEEAVEKLNPCDFEMENIVSVINKHSDRLLQNHQYLSAISGSSVRSQNVRLEQPQPCIVLYVIAKGKIPLHEHKFEDQIDGIPVVIREGMFETTTLPSQEFFRPVKMGCQITSNRTSSYGTLGGFYYHKDLGLCGITCAHVLLAESDMHNLRGEKKVWKQDSPIVYQPDTNIDEYRLGPVKEAVYKLGNEHSSGIDMAVFKIEGTAPDSGQFPSEPDICFETGRTLGTSGLRYNTQVLKYGRTTGLTRGYIMFEKTTVRMIRFERRYKIGEDEFTFLLKNQIEIGPISLFDRQMFNDGGDSGAFVFAEDTDKMLSCIGMCVGKLNGNGIVIPISVINEELGVSQFYDFRWNHLYKKLNGMDEKLDKLLEKSPSSSST